MKITEVKKTDRQMDITPTPTILALLENLSVEPWRCVAELVDNALDNFKENRVSNGKVTIDCESGQLIVSDNGTGMEFDQLELALKAGYSSKNKFDELGLFGIGFNVACARLGRKATVWTKTKSDKNWIQVEIDINSLIKQGTFLVQPKFVEIKTEAKAGTVVSINLHKEHLVNFERKKYLESISKELGKAYSFLLRSSVPGLTGDVSGLRRPVEIVLSGDPVMPWLPCIWDENREVTYKGTTVKAVQKFRKELPDSIVCNNCGLWDPDLATKECQRCHSKNVTIAKRSVWGWIGVQRYMDKLSFGINFIRNGRTILFNDQNIFTFNDPTTGESYKDYPVEWPADMGRIVGEVHCDHVRVDFIKREFDSEDPNYAGVIEIVRGNSSLQPMRKRGAQYNSSPLATVFNAFRINEPGLRYLIPGNGKAAIHQATQNWGENFYKGINGFETDDKWYAAAQAHDQSSGAAPGTLKSSSSSSTTISPLAPTTGGGTASSAGAGATPTTPIAPTLMGSASEKEKMSRWKSGGIQRHDLSKSINLPGTGRSFQVEAWETYSEITDDSGKSLPAKAIPIKGNEVHVFVSRNSDLVTKFGRTTTDIILTELVYQIKALTGSRSSVSTLYTELLYLLPDQEKSEKVMRLRISEMETRLQQRIGMLTTKSPADWWKCLSAEAREEAEQNSLAAPSPPVWSGAVKAGAFGNYLSLRGIKELVEQKPEDLFDGKLFKQHFATSHAQAARARSQGYIARALNDIFTISKIKSNLNAFEIQTAENSLGFVSDSIVVND